MRSQDLDFSRSPAEFIAPQIKPTVAAGEPAGRHAETDPAQLHRPLRLQPGPHGTHHHERALLNERLPRRLGERGRSAETHRGQRRRRAPRGRAPQARPDHLHSHVPAAVPAGAAHCVFHQLPAPELFLRLHAI